MKFIVNLFRSAKMHIKSELLNNELGTVCFYNLKGSGIIL